MQHAARRRGTNGPLPPDENDDRAGKDEFPITHEFLSELLGVRRQTISIIAGTLQRAGIISYRRGVLRVLDRVGLEDASCECYDVLKKLYDRIVRGRVVPVGRSAVSSRLE